MLLNDVFIALSGLSSAGLTTVVCTSYWHLGLIDINSFCSCQYQNDFRFILVLTPPQLQNMVVCNSLFSHYIDCYLPW